MIVKITEALEELKDAVKPEDYYKVRVEAGPERTDLKWTCYANGYAWSDDCNTFEGALANMLQRNKSKSRFVEEE